MNHEEEIKPIEDKESSGYSLFQGPTGPPQTVFQERLHGSEVRLKLESPVTSTGKSASPLLERKASIKRRKSLVPLHIVNSQDQKQPPTIVGRMIHELKEHNLNTEPNPSEETQRSTGNQSGSQQSPDVWMPYPLTFVWSIIGRYRCTELTKTIAADHSVCPALERKCYVYCGKTGTGKSRRAWDEATLSAYAKDPRTKFWCGYTNQQHVIIDEFRGGIDISHILRWLDRYPVRVEIKGSSRPLLATTIWITSNLHPREWYTTIDFETVQALLRRLDITEFE